MTTTETQPPTELSARDRIKAMAPTLLLDIALPSGVYFGASALGASDFVALTAGGVAAGLRVLQTVIRTRKIDGMAAIMLGVFAFGLLTAFLTGDEKFLLAKESLATGVIGLVFLGSVLIGKPLVYYTGRRFAGGTEAAERAWDEKWRTEDLFRRTLKILSVVWGVVLLVEAVVRVVLVYTLPVPTMVALSPVMMIGTIAVMIFASVRYGKAMRAKSLALSSKNA